MSGAKPTPEKIRDGAFKGADLSGLEFRNADLAGADLTGATLQGAELGGSAPTPALPKLPFRRDSSARGRSLLRA